MNLTLDRSCILSNLMIAYKNGDLAKYLSLLDRCESWLDPQLFSFFFNLSKNKQFTRKGYYK